jgi:hypothetical protein
MALSTSSVNIDAEKEAVVKQLGYLPSNFVRVSAWSRRGIVGSTHRVPLAIQTYPLQGGAKRRQAKAGVSDLPVLSFDSRTKRSDIQSPFPTLFWLACPQISKVIADLERRGLIQECHETFKQDAELSRRLLQCHVEYAQMRWTSLTEEHRGVLLEASSSASSPLRGMRSILQYSGISGTNLTGFVLPEYAESADGETAFPKHFDIPPIKCLHAHFAHYLSCSSEFGTGKEWNEDGLSHHETNPVGEIIRKQLAMEFPDLWFC